MPELIEMTVDSIRVHMPTGQHVVILKENDAERYLPIWIGVNEANAIALKITGITPERPVTHDLLAGLFGTVGAIVDRVVIVSLSNEVFYAQIVAHLDRHTFEIDCRPSDAIAVAVRVGAGIFVAQEVMEKAGVLPDPGRAEGSSDAEEEERVAKVRDWINELDVPDLGGDQPRPGKTT